MPQQEAGGEFRPCESGKLLVNIADASKFKVLGFCLNLHLGGMNN